MYFLVAFRVVGVVIVMVKAVDMVLHMAIGLSFVNVLRMAYSFLIGIVGSSLIHVIHVQFHLVRLAFQQMLASKGPVIYLTGINICYFQRITVGSGCVSLGR